MASEGEGNHAAVHVEVEKPLAAGVCPWAVLVDLLFKLSCEGCHFDF